MTYMDSATHIVRVGEGVKIAAVQEVDIESCVGTRAGPFHHEQAVHTVMGSKRREKNATNVRVTTRRILDYEEWRAGMWQHAREHRTNTSDNSCTR